MLDFWHFFMFSFRHRIDFLLQLFLCAVEHFTEAVKNAEQFGYFSDKANAYARDEWKGLRKCVFARGSKEARESQAFFAISAANQVNCGLCSVSAQLTPTCAMKRWI